MARDSVRPFVVGLLFVYLLDPPVRWLVRRGLRRSLAILIVYVVAIVCLRRVPGADADAAGQRDPALRRRLPEARRETSTRSSSKLGEFYAHLQIPAAIREWIDGVIAGIGQGGAGGGGGLDLTLPAAAPDRRREPPRAVFGYLILPVWVFYLLKDKAALVATVRSLASADLAVRHLGDHQDRRARLRAVGPRPAHPRLRGRDLHVHRADRPELPRGPDLRALRAPVVDHRGRPGAGPDHRPDHLGDPRGPAGGDRRDPSRSWPHSSSTSSSSRSRTTSSCPRSRATRSSSTRPRSSSRSSSAARWRGCSGRSLPCP